jgi:hypothetical protein
MRLRFPAPHAKPEPKRSGISCDGGSGQVDGTRLDRALDGGSYLANDDDADQFEDAACDG